MHDPNDVAKDNVVQISFDRSKDGQERQTANVTNATNAPQLSAKKRDLFEKFLSKGTVMIVVDARKSDVMLPKPLLGQADLRLNFCYNFHIADFNFNQKAVWATLDFDWGQDFCKIPWTAVYAMQSQPLLKGAVWFEDFPSDQDAERVLGVKKEDCTPVPDGFDASDVGVSDDKCNVLKIDFSKE